MINLSRPILTGHNLDYMNLENFKADSAVHLPFFSAYSTGALRVSHHIPCRTKEVSQRVAPKPNPEATSGMKCSFKWL